MLQFTVSAGAAVPVPIPETGGTITNLGAAALSYGSTPATADGTLSAGSSVTTHGTTYVSVLADGSESATVAMQLLVAQSDGVPAVATEADLPIVGDPPLMIFVRRDATALDTDGNPLPALYLWTGSAWVRGGLAGGGAADTEVDYITVDLVGALQDGQTLRWVDASDHFVPGVLVPE